MALAGSHSSTDPGSWPLSGVSLAGAGQEVGCALCGCIKIQASSGPSGLGTTQNCGLLPAG